MHICLVCSSFEGLYRNSGIGTFSAALARFLANEGHNVTVYYVNDQPVESFSFQYWVDYYAQWNIQLVPEIELRSIKVSSPPFQRHSYATYLYLKERSFDVVHFPDFEGLGYYSLLAKQDGLAFASTQFIVGLHGPTRWVREGNGEKLLDTGGLEVDFMEQRSIELADRLWTPSNSLAEWAHLQGWKLPKNVDLMPLLPGKNLPPPLEVDNSPITELVFFGRLEPRKGLFAFCDALDEVASTPGNWSEISVTFLGRSVLLEGGFEDSQSYLLRRKADWPFRVRFLGELPRLAALEYLQGNGRMAVLAGEWDNAPYTMSEVLWLGIPVVAVASPSVLPLVNSADHHLLAASAKELSAMISKRLFSGPVVLHPSSPMLRADLMWRGYYSEIAASRFPIQEVPPTPLISVVITHFNRPLLLAQALDSVRNQNYPSMEVVLVDDESTDPDAIQYLKSLESEFQEKHWQLLHVPHGYLGAARNRGAKAAKGEWILFLDDDNTLFPSALSTYWTAAFHSGNELMTAPHDVFVGTNSPSPANIQHRWLPLGPSLAAGLFKNCFGDANFFVNREMFLAEGGFTEEVGVGLEDHEFHAKVALHKRRIGVVPEPLLHYRMHDSNNQMLFTTDPLLNRLRYSRAYSQALGAEKEVLSVLATSQWAVRQVQCENSTVSDVFPRSVEVSSSEDIAVFTISGDEFFPYENCQGVRSASIGGVPCRAVSVTESTMLECEWSIADGLQQLGVNMWNVPLDVAVEFGQTSSDVLRAAVTLLDRRPRSVTIARFNNAITGVRVFFDGETNRGAMTGRVVGCAGLIASDSTLGTGYSCAWPSSSELLITIGTGATIVPGDSLTFNSGILSPTLTDFTFQVAGPPDPPRVVLSLNGPGFQAGCDGGNYVLLIQGRGGRPLTAITWTIQPAISRTLNIAEGESLTLGPTELAQGTTYTLTVSATNWLGMTGTTSLTIVKARGEATPPRVIMPPAQSIIVSETLFLTATVLPSACAPTGTTLSFNWRSVSVVPLGPSRTTQSLTVPPRTLSEGTYTFFFNATASSSQGSFSTISSVVVTVNPTPLVAAIRGGDFTVGLLTPSFQLDASISMDPDNPTGSLSYDWSCRRVGSIQTTCPISIPRTAIVSIPTNTLEVGAYDFFVMVSNRRPPAGPTSPPVRVTIVPGEPPIIQIDSVPLHTSSEKLTLTGRSIGSTPVASWQWSVVEGNNVIVPENLLSAADARVLVLRPNSLVPGSSYRFRLVATGVNGESVSTFRNVQVASPPCCGTFTVSPATGTAMSTLFTLEASLWQADTTLFYTFFSIENNNPNSRRALSERSHLSRLQLRLPVASQLMLEVSDARGAQVTTIIPVSVNLPELTYVEVWEQGLTRIQQEGDEGALGSLIQTVLRMAAESGGASIEIKEDMAVRTLQQARLFLSPERVESILLSLNQLSGTPPYSLPLLTTLIDVFQQVATAAENGQVSQASLERFVEAFFVITSRVGTVEQTSVARSISSLLNRISTLQTRTVRLQLNTISPGETPLIFEKEGGTMTIAKKDAAAFEDSTYGEGSSTVFLPSAIKDKIPASSSEVSVSAAQFNGNPHQDAGNTFSSVIEVNIFGQTKDKLQISEVDPPIVLNFTFSPPLSDQAQSLAQCSTLDEENRRWRSEGCEMVSLTASSASCACSHLSVFAVTEGEPPVMTTGQATTGEEDSAATELNVGRLSWLLAIAFIFAQF